MIANKKAGSANSLQNLPFTAAVVAFGAHAFNMDSFPLAQNETSIRLDPTNLNRIVGSYNDFRGIFDGNFTGWSVSNDGGNTVLKDGQIPTADILGETVGSGGDPVTAVDKNGNFFEGSLHFSLTTNNNAVTLWRSPKAGSLEGVFSSACTGGTDANCWPTSKVVAADVCDGSPGSMFNDKEWVAVDGSGSSASGSVYVVWTQFACDSDASSIVIAKCSNDLSTCTSPVALESTPGTGSPLDFVQLSHVTVASSGKVFVTWVKYDGNDPESEIDTIRLVVITPSASASSVGTVGPLRTVAVESQPIPFLAAPYPSLFPTATYPKVLVLPLGRAVIVWDRRTQPAMVQMPFASPDAFWTFNDDIVAKTTDNDGLSFSGVQIVSAAAGSQFQASLCFDSTSERVVIAYYSRETEFPFAHRQQVFIATSPNGSAPYSLTQVTSTANDTESDPLLGDTFFGDYMEVACGGGRAVVHYTANYVKKSSAILGGSSSLFINQQDNFLGRVRLP